MPFMRMVDVETKPEFKLAGEKGVGWVLAEGKLRLEKSLQSLFLATPFRPGLVANSCHSLPRASSRNLTSSSLENLENWRYFPALEDLGNA